MKKIISARVGEYEKDGKKVGKYVEIGVLIQKDGKEFILLDPAVNLAGVLAKQNFHEFYSNGQMRENVLCGIYDNSN